MRTNENNWKTHETTQEKKTQCMNTTSPQNMNNLKNTCTKKNENANIGTKNMKKKREPNP